MTQALGLVETVGFIPAVEAADAAAKGADVAVHGLRYAGRGLVTLVIFGNISEVKAAVEAAETAAKRLGKVRSSTTIGRTGDDIAELLGKENTPCTSEVGDASLPRTKARITLPDRQSLQQMKVNALRSLARDLPAFPMDRKTIKFARKAELIDGITAYKKG